jgi:hypothetical protein
MTLDALTRRSAARADDVHDRAVSEASETEPKPRAIMSWRPARDDGQARACTDPFPGHRPRPVDVAVFDQIEQVAKAVLELHAAMSQASREYRWLATSMATPKIADILTMLHEDDQSFAAQNIRDFSRLVTITPVAAPTP